MRFNVFVLVPKKKNYIKKRVMPYENPENIIRSWNQQNKFQLGPLVMDKLVPPLFGRIRTNHITVWREESLSNQLDWDSQNFSVYLPESLRVLASVYLQIDLPLIIAGDYKDYVGLYIIKTLRLVSAGQEVYTCNYADFMVDYLQSLSEEALKVFTTTYLGHKASADGAARRVMLPILLPNSAYLGRHGKSTRGNGIFPAVTGQNRLEIQITLNDAIFTAADSTKVPASISGACKFLYHEVQMRPADIKAYSNMTGWYKVWNRRFTELTSGWQTYTSGIVVHSLNQPQGLCTEVMLLAVATNADEHRLSAHNYVKADSFKVVADSIVQRDLDTPEKINAELWSNGFVPPADFPSPARICFGAHMADATHIYTGGYVMKSTSTVLFEFSFPVAVKYRLVAVQLQTVHILEGGHMVAELE